MSGRQRVRPGQTHSFGIGHAYERLPGTPIRTRVVHMGYSNEVVAILIRIEED